MKFCKECGMENEDSANRCANCGLNMVENDNPKKLDAHTITMIILVTLPVLLILLMFFTSFTNPVIDSSEILYGSESEPLEPLATTIQACYGPAADDGMICYFVNDGMLMKHNMWHQENAIELVGQIGFDDPYIVGITESEIYLTDREQESMCISLKTGEGYPVGVSSVSGEFRNVVIIGFYQDHVYYWCNQDLQATVYRSSVGEQILKKEVVFRDNKQNNDAYSYRIQDEILYYQVIEAKTAGEGYSQKKEYTMHIYKIKLDEQPYTSKHCFELEDCRTHTYGIFLTSPMYILCRGSNGKLYVYNSLTNELTSMKVPDSALFNSGAFDASNKRLYYWSGEMRWIEISNLADYTYHYKGNGYNNEDIYANEYALISKWLYFGANGLEYRISTWNGYEIEELR